MKTRTPFKRLAVLSIGATLLAPWASAMGAESSPTPEPATAATPRISSTDQPADIPAAKAGPDGQPDPGFVAAHERFVAEAGKGEAELVFLGDSITQGWGSHQGLWQEHFGNYRAVNFGISGDWTQHVLWRLENGELEGIQPKLVVLMIGTNNANGHAPDETAKGVTRIVETLLEKTSAKILLLGVFPRNDAQHPYRAKNEKVNEIISKLGDEQRVFYMDISDKFLEEDGSLPGEIMPDQLHLSAAGYQIWGEAIAPKIAELMR